MPGSSPAPTARRGNSVPACLVSVPLALAACALPAEAQTPALGRSEPSFQQPSLPPGVDYVVPTEAEIKATLDRIRDYFVRSTTYRVVDSLTGRAITDFSQPIKTAGVETFNDRSEE